MENYMPRADFLEGIGRFTTLSPIPAHGKKKFFYFFQKNIWPYQTLYILLRCTTTL